MQDRRIGILVCETVVPEIAAVVREKDWNHVEILGMPSGCTRAGVEVPAHLLDRDLDLHHIRCSCSPKIDAPVTVHDRIGGRRITNAFQLFLPGGVVDQYISEGAYLATSGWIVDWKRRMAQYGFDDTITRTIFRESLRSVVLINTGIRSDAIECGQSFSRYLGLPFTVVDAGLELATLVVAEIVQSAETRRLGSELARSRAELNQLKASETLQFELVRELSALEEEEQVVERIAFICSTLYSPTRSAIVTVRNGKIKHASPENLDGESMKRLLDFLTTRSAPYELLEDGSCLVRFCRDGIVNGGIWVAGFAFPQNRDQYLNSMLSLAPVCELVIARTRSLQGFLPVCSFCHGIRDSDGDWHRWETYLARTSSVLFSHSICPRCLREHYPDLSEDELELE